MNIHLKKGALLTSIILASSISSVAQATTYQLYNDINLGSSTGSGEELSQALVGSGVNLVAGSSQFQGNFNNPGFGGEFPDGEFPDGEFPDGEFPDGEFPNLDIPNGDGPGNTNTEYGSASFFSNLDFGTAQGTDFVLPDGILLTSGYAAPADSNTQSGFTGYASGVGEGGLDTLLSNAGFSDTTNDATALSFDFTVDAGVNAVSLDFIFGSEEYSEYVDSYPEIAAVFIDGVNYAGFANGDLLTMTSANVGAGNFVNNDIHNNAPVAEPLNVEYDGLSKPLTLTGLLDDSLDVHTIKIAVSDTNDSVLDTGLFVANLQGLTLGGPGGGSGTTSTDPLLPGGGTDDSFEFVIDVGDTGFGIDPGQPIFIDPYVATGYEYEVIGSTFATVTIPDFIGDGLYNVYYWDGSNYQFAAEIATGDVFDFLSINPAGFSKFMIDGIEVAAGLDPNDAGAFVTGVTFASGGSLNVTQTAIQTCDGSADCSTVAVPEPSILFLFGAGFAGLIYTRRRKFATKA